jgi:F-type H+-transporting ATPase subunit alpha
MKQVAGTLRLDLAQYRELEAFAAFGSDLDAATQRQLTRGARLVEVLKQPQFKPLKLENQVAIIYAGTKGYIDKYPVNMVAKYEAGLHAFLEARYADVLKRIAEEKKLSEEAEAKLNEALKVYGDEFQDTIK